MKSPFEHQLDLNNYNYVNQNDIIVIKTKHGNLHIKSISTKPIIIKKNNYNNYASLASILFFLIVIFIDRNELEKNSLYMLFVILFALNYTYNHIVLEMNKLRIYTILDKISGK